MREMEGDVPAASQMPATPVAPLTLQAMAEEETSVTGELLSCGLSVSLLTPKWKKEAIPAPVCIWSRSLSLPCQPAGRTHDQRRCVPKRPLQGRQSEIPSSLCIFLRTSLKKGLMGLVMMNDLTCLPLTLPPSDHPSYTPSALHLGTIPSPPTTGACISKEPHPAFGSCHERNNLLPEENKLVCLTNPSPSRRS
jgi:hypothetical protein